MESYTKIRVKTRVDELSIEKDIYNYDGQAFKRGNSWKYCYEAFSDSVKKDPDNIDYDYLALQLAFYLASWGMYRGSSFLLKLDYKIHIAPVKMMMEKQYRPLFACENPFADEKTALEYKNLLFDQKNGIYCRIEDYYIKAHRALTEEQERSDESDTLLTKILLGVYGCIPAYDRFFKRGLSLFGRQQWLRKDGNALFKGSKSLGELLKTGAMREELAQYHKEHPEYTFMKIVDMYFFSLGAYFEEGYDKLSSEDKKARTEMFRKEIEKKYLQ